MMWFLNNNNPGAAETAMAFSTMTEGIDATYFTYGKDDRTRAVRELDRTGRRVILCNVVRVEERVPNKDIVAVEIYPPFIDDRNEEAITALKLAMSAANNPSS